VRFNEMEWSLPAERGADALREIKALIARREFPLMFPLEYRWVRGDDLWLSPNHGRDSVHIRAPVRGHAVRALLRRRAGHLPQPRRPPALGQGAQPGGAHSQALSALGRLPALRERMDPTGEVPEPYLRNLFGLEAAPQRNELVDVTSAREAPCRW
jgi:L-gulonolactone oxidase